jgi:MoaA/NifB/PqqE/SkfB family radical SAM enzyme
MKNRIQPYPLQVQIVPTNRCCQNCEKCAYRLHGSPSNEKFHDRDELSFEKIIETLDCMADMHIPACHITGGGEPLVHPQIFEILKAVKDRNIELALVSNGQMLSDQLCEFLGDVSWVRISMDSNTPDTYSLMRRIPQEIFYRVIHNLSELVRYKKTTVLGVGFVVDHMNYKEIFRAAQFYKDMGVDNFRISAAFTPAGYGYFKSFESEASDLSKKAAALSDANFQVFNLFSDRVRDLFEGTQNYSFCPMKDLLTYVGADYNVYTCCTLAYNKKGFIGSLKEKTFKDVWTGAEKQKKFAGHNPSEMCRFPCMYKSKNDFINYCIKTRPRHINYI